MLLDVIGIVAKVEEKREISQTGLVLREIFLKDVQGNGIKLTLFRESANLVTTTAKGLILGARGVVVSNFQGKSIIYIILLQIFSCSFSARQWHRREKSN